MQVNTRESGSATIVDATGDIGLHTSPMFREALLNCINNGKSRSVMVNMSGVKYIDSSGVATLIEGLKSANKKQCGFAIFGLNRNARAVIEMAHLDKIFKIYETEEEALRQSTES